MNNLVINRIIIFIALAFLSLTAMAQVTIGSGIKPTRATLLDLKDRQSTTVINAVTDPDNISSSTGGLLLPRVALKSTNTLEPFVSITDPEWTDPVKQKALRMSVAGLMVYNTTASGSSLYVGLYTWNGMSWETSQANPSKLEVTNGGQPKSFTFYETGEGTVEPLTFSVSGASGTLSYQWYQITGNNVHVRVGTEIGKAGTIYTNTVAANAAGANTAMFSPQAILKGSTVSAKNTGFYKFYCVATDLSYGTTVTSDIAEIAVGCGAKNSNGEWMTFMCFNLGAQNGITIDEQKKYNIPAFQDDATGLHIYQAGEEKVWGDLYQWGRIADGHEKRTASTYTPTTSVSLLDEIGSGYYCNRTTAGTYTGDRFPYQQVKNTSPAYGKFIVNTLGTSNSGWYPITDNQALADQLWRSGAFPANDPCGKYKIDGTFVPAWTTSDVPEGQTTSNDAACEDADTRWRLPQQEEWGAIFKGGAISGSPAIATANTWTWYTGDLAPNLNIEGYEIKPDGVTPTLFIPASGTRAIRNGSLYSTLLNGYYWTSSTSGLNSSILHITRSVVNPGRSMERGSGHSVRCIKN